jgi:hypothetical protein
MGKSFFVLIIFFPLGIFAQNREGYSVLQLTGTPQYFLNKKFNIDDNVLLPNPLSTTDQVSGYFGIAYERVTHYGLIYNAGIVYGVQKHDIKIFRDLSDFDPDATYSLHGLTFTKMLRARLPFVAPRIEIGYRYAVSNKTAVVFKASALIKLFLSHGIRGGFQEDVTYQLDTNAAVSRSTVFQAYSIRIGDDKKNPSTSEFDGKLHVVGLYLGVERNVKIKWMRTVFAGFEINRALRWNSSNFMSIVSKPNWLSGQESFVNQQYYDRNISIGLRVGVGLWK